MVKEELKNTPESSLLHRIQNSGNQFFQFKFFSDIDALKKEISKIKFKTLEEFTRETRETLDLKYPDICE